jgi:hypothetical protein
MSMREQTAQKYFTLCERATQAEAEYAAARDAFEEAVERGGYAHAFKWKAAALLMAEVRRTWMAPVAQVLGDLAGGHQDLTAARAELERLRQYHIRQLLSERSWEQGSHSPEASRLGELEATVRTQVIGILEQLCEVELAEPGRGIRRR